MITSAEANSAMLVLGEALSRSAVPISLVDPLRTVIAFTMQDDEQHPLTIPGELLAEACKLGHTSFEQDGNGWTASLVMKTEHSYKYVQGVGSAPAEALQSAIDKAREYLEKVK